MKMMSLGSALIQYEPSSYIRWESGQWQAKREEHMHEDTGRAASSHLPDKETGLRESQPCQHLRFRFQSPNYGNPKSLLQALAEPLCPAKVSWCYLSSEWAGPAWLLVRAGIEPGWCQCAAKREDTVGTGELPASGLPEAAWKMDATWLPSPQQAET